MTGTSPSARPSGPPRPASPIVGSRGSTPRHRCTCRRGRHCRPPDSSRYTTISHWWENGWVSFAGEEYQNDKRSSFLDFIEVPRLSSVPLELATNLTEGDAEERESLLANGWHIRRSSEVSRDPSSYRDYIQRSRGEFSCAKPSCMRLQNAWVSDRSICYLATGRPVVVQHTGPSRLLPDAAGMLRFRDPEEAVLALQRARERPRASRPRGAGPRRTPFRRHEGRRLGPRTLLVTTSRSLTRVPHA